MLCRAAGGLAFPPLAGQERFAWVIANLFIGGAARHMLPELTGVARGWSADLIVRESLEFAGCTAAEALGLPHAAGLIEFAGRWWPGHAHSRAPPPLLPSGGHHLYAHSGYQMTPAEHSARGQMAETER